MLVPEVLNRIKTFMTKEGFTTESRFDSNTSGSSPDPGAVDRRPPDNSSLKKTFDSLSKVIEAAEDASAKEGDAGNKSPWETAT